MSATTITLEVSANVCVRAVVRRKQLNFGFWFATQRNGLLAMSCCDVIYRVRTRQNTNQDSLQRLIQLPLCHSHRIISIRNYKHNDETNFFLH